jgi:hypothetical protein
MISRVQSCDNGLFIPIQNVRSYFQTGFNNIFVVFGYLFDIRHFYFPTLHNIQDEVETVRKNQRVATV